MPLSHLASKLRRSVKNFFTPGMLFECFGFRYFGPVNGHDLDSLLDTLSFIKTEGVEGGPYLIHVLTTKGKGYKRAEELPLKYHGVSPFKVEDGIQNTAVKKANYQDIFADTMIRLAKEDPRIIAVTAAMPSGTGLNKFQKEFPGRCYDVGIAEAHAVTFCAGLATEGFRPVAAIYSTFLQRAFDQIITTWLWIISPSSSPWIAAESWARRRDPSGRVRSFVPAARVPNMVVMAPKDENELQHMIKTAIQYQSGPIALRYPRGEVVGVTLDKELKTLPIGKGELISADSDKPDVLFIGIGYGVQSALEAQKLVQAKGHPTAFINARFAKPLDETLLHRWISAARLVVTVEENSVCGGFGAAVLEMLQKYRLHRDVLILGMPDSFVEHATPKQQREMMGLDGAGIARKVFERLQGVTDDTLPAPDSLPPHGPAATYEAGITLQ